MSIFYLKLPIACAHESCMSPQNTSFSLEATQEFYIYHRSHQLRLEPSPIHYPKSFHFLLLKVGIYEYFISIVWCGASSLLLLKMRMFGEGTRRSREGAVWDRKSWFQGLCKCSRANWNNLCIKFRFPLAVIYIDPVILTPKNTSHLHFLLLFNSFTAAHAHPLPSARDVWQVLISEFSMD